MIASTTLEQGRKAYQKQAWGDAYTFLSSADNDLQIQISPEDLKQLATAAYLTGKKDDCAEIWARAHKGYLEDEELRQAINCAFWLGIILINQGEGAQGSGWIARADRLAKQVLEDCVEKGFLLLPKALQHLREGDGKAAYDIFKKAGEIGNQFDNRDLITLSQLGRGQARINQQKISEGTALLDESMVAVVTNEVSPIVTGIVYCAVIEACQKIYDLRRAREWTAALSRWCDSHPNLVPFRGWCLIRRTEIMQLHGEWPQAMDESHKACKLLSEQNGDPIAGEAFYQQAELYRLKGEFTKAEETYSHASKWGRHPQPGLSLLRLDQGKIDVAESAIRHVETEKKDPAGRSRILPAYIQIMLAVGNLEAAQAGANELTKIASAFQAPFLRAIASQAEGNILLKKEEPQAALDKLLNAWAELKRIGASYETAKTRVLIGHAYREMGDNDTAEMEFDAARWQFQQLGAAHDISKIDSLLQTSAAENTHGLTSRELQVLRSLTSGKTNKEIGADLYISERTVDRHVSNILSKLNVPTRAAATAYAYEHDLT